MANILTGTVIAEKYRLGELLRSGGHGDLYDARHVLMDKPASVLVLRPSLASDRTNAELFFERARAEAKISHPHVLNISDFGTDREGFVYAVYEPLVGKPLNEVIADEGAFPIYSAVETARQSAEAMSASHAAGQTHGNLTANNIFLTGNEGIFVKVTGFGSPNPLVEERTNAMDFAYLPPEVCSGHERSDFRGDVYAIGVVLYQMLAGIPPFIGEKPSEVMIKHIEEMPPPLSAFRHDLPDGLEPVIIKALSKDPEMRQQSAQEFADELVAATSNIGPTPAAEPQNNLWKTAFIVLVGMTLLSAFLIYGTYMKTTDPATAQPDANAMPVQPINPATGTEEQNLAAMPPMTADAIANSNVSQVPDTLPGGDGYNPWGNGGIPPPGAPVIPPGGQVITVPGGQSPFMADSNCIPQPSGVLLCTVPVSPTPTPKPAATPKPSPAADTNTTPAATPAATPRTTPSPAKSPPANRPNNNDRSSDQVE